MTTQAANAAAAALRVTTRAGVLAKPAHTGLAAKQSHAAHVCRLMASTSVFHGITWITTHLPTPKRWEAELAWLVDL